MSPHLSSAFENQTGKGEQMSFYPATWTAEQIASDKAATVERERMRAKRFAKIDSERVIPTRMDILRHRRSDHEFDEALVYKGLSYADMILYWQHYTTGKGAGSYSSVDPEQSFRDYTVNSAWETQYEIRHDI